MPPLTGAPETCCKSWVRIICLIPAKLCSADLKVEGTDIGVWGNGDGPFRHYSGPRSF